MGGIIQRYVFFQLFSENAAVVISYIPAARLKAVNYWAPRPPIIGRPRGRSFCYSDQPNSIAGDYKGRNEASFDDRVEVDSLIRTAAVRLCAHRCLRALHSGPLQSRRNRLNSASSALLAWSPRRQPYSIATGTKPAVERGRPGGSCCCACRRSKVRQSLTPCAPGGKKSFATHEDLRMKD